MKRELLASVAVLFLLAGPALAQTETTPATAAQEQPAQGVTATKEAAPMKAESAAAKEKESVPATAKETHKKHEAVKALHDGKGVKDMKGAKDAKAPKESAEPAESTPTETAK
jgi:hypothetical protein